MNSRDDLKDGEKKIEAFLTHLAVYKKVAPSTQNQTLGASNISFSLPERGIINQTFLTLAISSGVTCPTVNVANVRAAILSTDLVLGHDRFAQRYMR